jgi:hypothetical protein
MQLPQGFRQTLPAWKAEQHHAGAVQYAWLAGFELRYAQRK